MIKMEEFNSRNNISHSNFDILIHNQILLIVFEEIVSILESEKKLKIDTLDGYRSLTDKSLYTMRFMRKYFSIDFNRDELDIITTWIFAYFRKSNVREKISNEKREILLANQKHECFYCKRNISITNLEVDHKIPWKLVGDELHDNLVATCFDCNREKRGRTDLGLKWLILKR